MSHKRVPQGIMRPVQHGGVSELQRRTCRQATVEQAADMRSSADSGPEQAPPPPPPPILAAYGGMQRRATTLQVVGLPQFPKAPGHIKPLRAGGCGKTHSNPYVLFKENHLQVSVLAPPFFLKMLCRFCHVRCCIMYKQTDILLVNVKMVAQLRQTLLHY